MKYYKEPLSQKVYAYDEEDQSQLPLIDLANKNKWEDVTSGFSIAPTQKQIEILYSVAAQNNLDFVAGSWGYTSLLSAASYVNSTNAQYKAEAEALIAWRDVYWAEAYKIQAGSLPASVEDFVAMLPAAPSKPTV